MTHVKSAFVFLTMLSLIVVVGASSARAELDYGEIQPPPEKIDQVAKQDAVPFRWMATYQDTPVYKDSECKEQMGKLAFREEFFELWRGEKEVLLGKGKYDEAASGTITITSVVGYAERKDVIVSSKNRYQALRAQNKVFRKALVVHRWDKAGAAITAEAVLRNGPDPKAANLGDVSLFEFLYVYKVSGDPKTNDGYCLVGTDPHCEVALPELHKERLLGWLENRRVFFWDHREGAEFNKDQQALRWRRDQNQPIKCYVSEENVRAKKASVVEELKHGEAWKYYVPRYPITSPDRVKIGGVEHYQLGVIGDTYEAGAGGGRVATAALEAQIRDKLSNMRKNASKLEVLFVIDATGSMQLFFESIATAVATIRKDLQGNRENPIRYSVMYYRDYSEENDKDSWHTHFVDFVTTATFGAKFPHVESKGGMNNPPPLFALDTAVKKASWEDGSMRVVILIGDMGNQQPDARGFNVKRVVDTLKESRCQFFAIQAQPIPVDVAAVPAGDRDRARLFDDRIRLFNAQAREIALALGMPAEQAKILSANGVDVAPAIFASAEASSKLADQLRGVLKRLQSGQPLTDSIHDVLQEAGLDLNAAKPPAPGGKTNFIKGGHGARMENWLLAEMEENGIDPAVFARKRIQHFGIAFSPVRIPGSPHDSFKTRILMSRGEFQELTTLMSKILRYGVTPAKLAELWRGLVNQLTGDLDNPILFDENTPLSEYMTKVLGIPVQSELLKKTVIQIKRMPPVELGKQRAALRVLYDKMNYYDNEMAPDGLATEKHWFNMRGDEAYGWIPMEMMP